jgi:hypothetical protein
MDGARRRCRGLDHQVGGKLPVKLSIGGYYNVVTPQYGAKWQLQSVFAAIF